ncbi:acyl-CoA dehydrogenase family protein [Kitasatospora sp. NPDC053057]|uniref:acyl-CoA dehydrogenase family protein n=1 Tax=Kitasatospora sp. NPDC053057 TaxID=3364062 RepID=UPI0037CAEE71
MADTRVPLPDGALGLAPVAAKHAADADQQRRLHPDVVQGVVAAGFARHFVPERWGGEAGGFADLLAAVATVGEGCTSAAWVAALTATVPRMAAHLPIAGQQEIWADGPDPMLVGALMPLGRAERAPGGWRLTGTWSFVSAVEFADWALVCARTPGEDGEPVARYFAVRRGEFRVQDTWFTVGMRGTGSNTLTVDDVFVPDRRVCTRAAVLDGECPGSVDGCTRVPLKAVNGLSFAAPVLGATRALLSGWADWVAPKIAGTGGGDPALADNATRHQVLARSAAEIDAAQLLLERTARVADERPVSALHAVRGGRDCAVAAELLLAAADRLFRAAGTSGQVEGSPFARAWRDVNVAVGHLVLRFDPAASAYAQRVLAER